MNIGEIATQFALRHGPYGACNSKCCEKTEQVIFDANLNTLMRSFIEEFCKIRCVDCKEGKPLRVTKRYGGSGASAYFYSHPPHKIDCRASSIRYLFAWVEGVITNENVSNIVTREP